MKISVFLGVIGSGKNYYSKICYDNSRAPIYISFSEPIRNFVWGVLGWQPRSDEEYASFKDKFSVEVRTEDDKVLHSTSGRKILQNLGTDVLRNMYRDDIWAEIWGMTAKKVIESGLHSDIIAYDCRYVNEVEKIFEVAEQYNCDVEFRFCDFRSERYVILEHESEKLAVSLLGKFKDQEDITEYMKERYSKHFSMMDLRKIVSN